MKAQYLLMLLALVAVLTRDVMGARNETEPDENEPDEDEPDENEPDEDERHNKHHRAAVTSIVYTATTSAAHIGSSHSPASSLSVVSAISSKSSWVGGVSNSAPVATPPSSSIPSSISVARPITGPATGNSNQLQVSFGVISIGVLAIILALL